MNLSKPEVVYPMTQAEAAAVGSEFFKTGKLCKYGHQSERRTSSGACMDCYRGRRASDMRAKKSFVPTLGGLSAALNSLNAIRGPQAAIAWNAVVGTLAHLITRGDVPPALVSAALANAPLQTDDGKLWALTKLGREVGRERVAELMAECPGETMTFGWVEAL